MMNKVLSQMFTIIGNYEKKRGKIFPARALWKTARVLSEISEITFDTDLSKQKGIGKSALLIIKEYLETGRCQRYEDAKIKLNSIEPDEASKEDLCQIPGIGPSKANTLIENDITNKAEFYSACEKLLIGDEITNTGIKFTNAIWAGMQFEAHTDKDKMTQKEHDEIADPMMNTLKATYANAKVAFAGSRRREKKLIGDIDIIIAILIEYHYDISNICAKLLDHTVTKGMTKVSGIKSKKHVDFRIVEPKYFESMMLHTTGSADLNMKMRIQAKKLGYKLNEYGLVDKEKNTLITTKEKDIFKTLKMKYIEPKNRNFKFNEIKMHIS